MKKNLLSLAAAAFMALGVQAAPMHLVPADNGKFSSVNAADLDLQPVAKAPAKAAEGESSMYFSPAGDPYSALGFNGQKSRQKQAYAVEFTPENARLFAGNTMTGVTVYTGVRNNYQKNYIRKGTIFLTYDLEETPFYTQDITLPTTAFTAVNTELTTPLDIEDGKPFFIGFEYALSNASDYAIVIDALEHEGVEGGWVATYDTANKKYVWDNLADMYGFCCIGATITGSNLPTNGASVSGIEIPAKVYSNTKFNFDVYVTNKASNDINSIELSYTIGNDAPVVETYNFQTALPYDKMAQIEVANAVSSVAGLEIPVSVEVTKVNGVENLVKSPAAVSTNVFAPGTGYPQVMVMEEGTGTWCGYCPQGMFVIDGLKEYAKKGTFIPVAIHGNDEMQNNYFLTWLNTFGNGFPCAYVNRKYDAQIAAAGNYGLAFYKSMYDEITSYLSIASVKAECSYSNEAKTEVTFKTTTEFAFDFDNSKNRFRLCYILTEDGVGPYKQSNNYAGSNVSLGGWEKKGSSVEMLYEDVAIYVDPYAGVTGSIPTTIKSGEKYEYTYKMTIPRGTYANANKVNFIVYVLDSQTGEIVNATVSDSADKGDNSGIADAVVDSNENAPVEYFNLQGVRVENPAAGNLYIRRQGTEVKKVIL